MSSWPTRRWLLLLPALTLACERSSTEQKAAPVVRPPSEAAPPVAPGPWFEGAWQGQGRTEISGGSVSAALTMDADGQATGTTSLGLSLQGIVDGDAVRLEGQGPGGHGVVVLHRHADTLQGILHYAPPDAQQGSRVSLTLRPLSPRPSPPQ